jgi:hypothetical protein
VGCGVDTTQLKRVVAELMRCVAKWILSGRALNLELPRVGKLQVRILPRPAS